MQGIIEKIGKTKKGKPVIKVGGVDYISKTENPAFVEGREVSFQFTPSPFQGKTYNHITEGSLVVVGAQAQAPSGKSAPAEPNMKNRTFAASYAKDIVVAGKAELTDWEHIANRINNWINDEDDIEFPGEGEPDATN